MVVKHAARTDGQAAPWQRRSEVTLGEQAPEPEPEPEPQPEPEPEYYEPEPEPTWSRGGGGGGGRSEPPWKAALAAEKAAAGGGPAAPESGGGGGGVRTKIKLYFGDDVRKVVLMAPFSFGELLEGVEARYGMSGLQLAYKDEDGDIIVMVDDGDIPELMEQEKIAVYVSQ